MEKVNQVTLDLEDYNFLRNEYTLATKENKELNAAIEQLQDNDGQKVIIRECEQWEDEDGEEYETRTTYVKGFDEVKAEVEEFYKGKLEDLQKKIEDLRKEKENYGRMYLDAQCTISELKHRNLWQRILNK
jgi:uncharacterized coiled-coil DUF342 family protein